MTDPVNINLKLAPTRPRGWIRVTWQALPVGDNTEFLNMACHATMAIMKNLQNRPLAVKELQYKLRQDCDSQVLLSLCEFLKQPSVIAKGITAHNVHQHLTTSGLLVVFNPHSSSSKVRLCVDPSHQSQTTKKSVNDLF